MGKTKLSALKMLKSCEKVVWKSIEIKEWQMTWK